MAQSFDQLVDTVLEMSLTSKEIEELYMDSDDDPTPTIIPEPAQAAVAKFKPKHVICGPDRSQHAAPQHKPIMSRIGGRAAAQARLTRRDTPYSPGKRRSGQVTSKSVHHYPPRPCPPPNSFLVPPPPVDPGCTRPVSPKHIAPLVILTKPKLTEFMIETLASSLITQCKMNFNIAMNEDEVKDFLGKTTLENVVRK